MSSSWSNSNPNCYIVETWQFDFIFMLKRDNLIQYYVGTCQFDSNYARTWQSNSNDAEKLQQIQVSYAGT